MKCTSVRYVILTYTNRSSPSFQIFDFGNFDVSLTVPMSRRKEAGVRNNDYGDVPQTTFHAKIILRTINAVLFSYKPDPLPNDRESTALVKHFTWILFSLRLFLDILFVA
jgi:hypothetical protein